MSSAAAISLISDRPASRRSDGRRSLRIWRRGTMSATGLGDVVERRGVELGSLPRAWVRAAFAEERVEPLPLQPRSRSTPRSCASRATPPTASSTRLRAQRMLCSSRATSDCVRSTRS
jgi:hypothetical protein